MPSSTPHIIMAYALACLLQAGSANAHLPELYGREYRRVDPLALVTPNRSIDARPAELPSEQEAEAAQKLAEAESLGGAYDPGQADPLVNMAQLQLERGEDLEAEQSLRRAIHLIRINEGLYHPSQLPMLRNLMEMYREQGNYPALGDSVGYYYRVLNPAASELSGEKLEQTLEYLRWERELFATRDDGDQREHILRAYRASEALLARAEDDEDAEADANLDEAEVGIGPGPAVEDDIELDPSEWGIGAAAVAAYGQILRGDELMMGFDHQDVEALAGSQRDYLRQEFLELNAIAASARGGG